MPNISTGTTSIPFGSSLRIGYRANGSTAAFTYINYVPNYNELPYTFAVPTAGTWEIEYTVLCPNCSGANYSNTTVTTVTVS